MENTYSYYRQGKPLENEEFQEGDVWGVFRETRDSVSWASRPIKIPRSNKNLNSLESHSAPVDIPKKARSWLDGSNVGPNYNHGMVRSSWESDDDDDEENVVPPHEFIARKLARSQISSFSVCEGVGRTLKGRDLRRVRNAVLTITGFLE